TSLQPPFPTRRSSDLARITSNSVFSAAASAAGAAAPPASAATATGAAAETPHFSSSILDSSAASITVKVDRSSTSFAKSGIFYRSEEHTSELQSRENL